MQDYIETMEEEYERTRKVDLVSLCNKNISARSQLNQINKEVVDTICELIKTEISIKNFSDRSVPEIKKQVYKIIEDVRNKLKARLK